MTDQPSLTSSPLGPSLITIALGILVTLSTLGCGQDTPSEIDSAHAQTPIEPEKNADSTESADRDSQERPSEKASQEPLRLEPIEGAFETFVHQTGAKGEYRYPEIMGSGCVLFDFDGDSDLDAYLIQSGPWPDCEDSQATPNRLFRNDGKGSFVDVTEETGLGDAGYGMGACAGDYDNDGDIDIWVNNFGRSSLYRNEDGKRFVDVTEAVSLGTDVFTRWWATSACWLDYDLDGDLDLYVAHYVDYSHDKNIPCGVESTGKRDYCSPKTYSGLPDALYRNDGPGEDGHHRFVDVFATSGIGDAQEDLRHAAKGLGVMAADFDGDGWPDLYVANDLSGNLLYLNQQDGTFSEEAFERGCSFSWDGMAQASMGVACADFDGDLDLDVFMTHLDLETNTLYVNDGEGFFEDLSAKIGVGTPSYGLVGFGTEAIDIDNDGDQDLLVTNGHVLLNIEETRGGVIDYAQPDQLLINEGQGKFRDATKEVGPYLSEPTVGRGLAKGDIDEDGDLDVLLNLHGAHDARNYRCGGVLLRNQGGHRAHSVSLRLVGDGVRANRQAIGARVTASVRGQRLLREVFAGSSYGSQSDTRIHLGLGDHSQVESVEIRWPDREHTVEAVGPLKAGSTYTIVMGQGVTEATPFLLK